MNASPNIYLFLNARKISRTHYRKKNTITPSKLRIDAIQKLQPPSNRKKIQEFYGMLTFLSEYVYKIQLYLKPFYFIFRTTNANSRNQKTFHGTNFKLNSRSQSTILCNVRCFKLWHRCSFFTISHWNK